MTTLAGDRRQVIVNADDFGRSPGINRGVFRAFEQGIVTSASLMVRWPAAVQAAAYARTHEDLSVGLHVDLGEWVFQDNEWRTRYGVVATENADGVRGEVQQQLATFQDLMGRPPTHLDSHQHVHRTEPVRGVLLELADALDVPLRQCTPAVRYCGDFFGQTHEGVTFPHSISVEALLELLSALPPGTTELACHPAQTVDWDSSYAIERTIELQSLCDPRVRSFIRSTEIQLVSFATFAGKRRTEAAAPSPAGPLSPQPARATNLRSNA